MSYADMCRRLPQGQADADALLDGSEMPSVAQEKGRRLDTLLAAGGEMR